MSKNILKVLQYGIKELNSKKQKLDQKIDLLKILERRYVHNIYYDLKGKRFDDYNQKIIKLYEKSLDENPNHDKIIEWFRYVDSYIHIKDYKNLIRMKFDEVFKDDDGHDVKEFVSIFSGKCDPGTFASINKYGSNRDFLDRLDVIHVIDELIFKYVRPDYNYNLDKEKTLELSLKIQKQLKEDIEFFKTLNEDTDGE